MLLKMAFLVKAHPEHSLHSIALEVARVAQSHQKVRIALESLTSKLRRDFARRRQVWLSLARNRDAPDERVTHEEASRQRSSAENRVLGRLIKLLPDSIYLYDHTLREMQTAHPEKTKLLKRLGRRRVELLLEEAIGRFRSSGSVGAVGKSGGPPRTVLQLVEAELLQKLEDEMQAKASHRRVGRKPAN